MKMIVSSASSVTRPTLRASKPWIDQPLRSTQVTLGPVSSSLPWPWGSPFLGGNTVRSKQSDTGPLDVPSVAVSLNISSGASSATSKDQRERPPSSFERLTSLSLGLGAWRQSRLTEAERDDGHAGWGGHLGRPDESTVLRDG